MSDMKRTTGKQYWRSLDQLAETQQFKEWLHREFPAGASEFDNAWSRRSFLTLMGASVALAGLSGCRRPVEKIVPYVTQPEEVTPGVPHYYATAIPAGLTAYGVLVKSNEGRPTKIEGNPAHPSSLGSSTIHQQAEILNLYDPDRSRQVLKRGSDSTWDSFAAFWKERLAAFTASKGAGLAVLARPFNSPTMKRLAERFRETFPQATWATFEPISDYAIYQGTKAATGKELQPVYDFGQAEVIVSLESDFLYTETESIRATRGFADGRRMTERNVTMNRLYVVESAMSVTGAAADHRVRMPSSQIGTFALALAAELQRNGLNITGLSAEIQSEASAFNAKWLSAVAHDLMRARGKSLVVAGRKQSAQVHALVTLINSALGNIGRTVTFVEPVDAGMPNQDESRRLVDRMSGGEIDTLILLGGNPVYDAPVDWGFDEALGKVKHAVHMSSHVDETSVVCEWHLPEAYFLESWGDFRSADGTASLVQPLIEPLFGGRSPIEVLAHVVTGDQKTGYELTRETWSTVWSPITFESNWRRSLHDGLVRESALPTVSPKIDGSAVAAYLRQNPMPSQLADATNLEITFAPSHLFDGRYANNGWLQELPDPITKIAWDNVACISKKIADAFGLANGEMAHLEYKGRTLDIPVWIQPGQADHSVSLQLGYGRTEAGRVGTSVGANAYLLRSSDSLYFGLGVKLTRLGDCYMLANVQDHGSMEGRPILREAPLQQYQRDGKLHPEMIDHPPLTALWDEHKYDEGYQWGMTIDLTACTGCNACTIACQSENNIPIVGKEQVSRGREMHWIRLDRYFSGDVENPEVAYQPMACQHCENAPCEQVCPVAATVHDREGLNVMVYNRCIGTRYCSNNCPYKVRRFNFFNYTKELPETVQMQQNPDVTVRSRGVMEKCTYCIQRINAGKFNAKKEGRPVKDGEIVTACQQVCPAKAITFGNINDPNAKVVVIKKNDRNYRVLEEFNTRTRTSYLGKLRNPNPELGTTELG